MPANVQTYIGKQAAWHGLNEDNDADTFPEQRGTGYNLLNAITGYVDHERGGVTQCGYGT